MFSEVNNFFPIAPISSFIRLSKPVICAIFTVRNALPKKAAIFPAVPPFSKPSNRFPIASLIAIIISHRYFPQSISLSIVPRPSPNSSQFVFLRMPIRNPTRSPMKSFNDFPASSHFILENAVFNPSVTFISRISHLTVLVKFSNDSKTPFNPSVRVSSISEKSTLSKSPFTVFPRAFPISAHPVKPASFFLDMSVTKPFSKCQEIMK